MDKHCKLISDDAESGVRSGSSVFTNGTFYFKFGNELVRLIRMGTFIGHKKGHGYPDSRYGVASVV